MIQQLIADEKFVNIQKAQAGLTNLLLSAEKTGSFYRVLKNDQPLGVLMPQNLWESLVEDLEALSSPTYRMRIAKSRGEKKSTKSDVVKKMLGI